MEQSESKLRIKHTRLIDLQISGKMPYVSGAINFKNSNLTVESTLSHKQKTITVLLKYVAETEIDKKDLFSINSTFEGVFNYSDDISNEMMEMFAKANAPAIVYPFLRGTLSFASLSGGFPPLTLPIINFTQFPVTLKKVD